MAADPVHMKLSRPHRFLWNMLFFLMLTGLIAALIGQGMEPFEAACRGVWQHGAAADRLATEIGPVGFLASDVAAALPRVL